MRKLLAVIMLMACAATAVAQEALTLDNDSKGKYLAAIREAKHEFLTRELQLTDEQQAEFFPIYDEMDDEISRINSETRALERKVSKNENATDTELESAARTVYEQKGREAQVEMAYYEKFKTILTPRQLLRLKNAERKFTQQLVRQHGSKKQLRDKADIKR